MSPHRLSPPALQGLGPRRASLSCDGPGAVSRARSEVRAVCGDGLSEARLADALLLTSELVTNSLLHVPAGPVTLWAGTDARRLLVEVHDSGPGLGPDGGPPGLPGPTELGGRGLFLVDRLADAWGHRDLPWAAVWFELRLDE